MDHPYDYGVGRASARGTDIGKRRTMAKRNIHSYQKVQKELKRKKKAKEKLERRQGKNDKDINDVEQQKDSD